jgi:hypothetical protein
MWASPRNPKAGESRDFYAEKGDNGWLEPIWNDGDKIFTYFENMSRAMALSCRGETYVSKYFSGLSLAISTYHLGDFQGLY